MTHDMTSSTADFPKVTFDALKKVHFIGIGGIGISAIARMMHLEGKVVTGSDRAVSHVTEELEKADIKVLIGQKAENISAGTDLVIYTIAIPDDNPELVQAKKLGIPCMTYPQALGQVSKDKFTIAISGTHGKTTTTAMIAKILMDAGRDPTVIIGSFLKDGAKGRDGKTNDHTNFIAGKSKYLIAEACEYKRSFLNLHPSILVITNIDDDHLDYYKDLDDIESAFSQLASQIKSGGALVCDLELPRIYSVATGQRGRDNRNVVDFELFGDQNLKLRVPGEHNLNNAAAALAVADLIGIRRVAAEESLRNFHGTWRRFEYLGETAEGAIVYDDYGHHPTEVRATLKGARDMFPDRKIFVVFQPHLYSRTKQHLSEFGTSFIDVNDVTIAPIYPAREPFDPTITPAMVAAEITKNSASAKTQISARAAASFDEIFTDLRARAKKGDVIITMGAGDINDVANRLVGR